MKYILTIILALFIGACGTKEVKKKPTVNVLTSVLYMHNANNNDHRISVARKMVTDTFSFKFNADSSQAERTKIRDSFYFLPFTDSIPGRKDTMAVKWIPLPKNLLIEDYNKSW